MVTLSTVIPGLVQVGSIVTIPSGESEVVLKLQGKQSVFCCGIESMETGLCHRSKTYLDLSHKSSRMRVASWARSLVSASQLTIAELNRMEILISQAMHEADMTESEIQDMAVLAMKLAYHSYRILSSLAGNPQNITIADTVLDVPSKMWNRVQKLNAANPRRIYWFERVTF